MKTPRIRKYKSVAEATSGGTEEPTRKLNPRKKKSVAPAKPGKLSKSDPDYYSKIGKISAANRLKKQGTSYYSDIAKKSHPRAAYNGGRPKKAPEPENA